ncbi:MAG: hypothetical protein K1X54_06615 [Flavobacteriales bacterium]|nr:hypothetical protein [Flavobacteriales bacterium]
MKFTRFFVIATLLTACSALVISCSTPHDYTVQINALDSVKTKTEDLISKNNMAMLEWGSQYTDSMLLKIRFVQDNFKGVMKTGDALMVSAYSNAALDMLQVKIDIEDAGRQLATFHNEITTLQKALREHATHDKAGNEINENYVQQVLKKENENLGRFGTRLDELVALLKHATEISSQYKNQIEHIADSLQNTIKRN